MKPTLLLTLTVLSAALLTQCGDNELSPNEKMSQESLVKSMESYAASATPAVAPAISPGAMSDPTKQPDKPLSGAEDAVLTDAPHVPPPITRDHPTKVTVKLEVQELVKRMADGVDYTF